MVHCGNFRFARMTYTMRLLLIAAILTGAHCEPCRSQLHCDEILEYNMECQLGNSTLTLEKERGDMIGTVIIVCKSPGITCSDLPKLPCLNLTNLELRSCPPGLLRCVDQVFQKHSVRRINLFNITEALVSEDVQNLEDATLLTVYRSHADTIYYKWTNLFFLHSLQGVLIIDAGTELNPNLFNHSPHLEELLLQKNHSTHLPNHTFANLPKLRFASANGNYFGNISVDAFKGLGAVESIILSKNNISYIEVGAFSDTLNLRKIAVIRNELGLLPNGLLERLERLERFAVHDNKIELILGSHALANLPSLSFVRLSRCGLRTVPENLFQGSNNIQHINMSENFITELSPKIFTSLPCLRNISLRQNNIHKIDGVFNNIKSLQFLDLSFNKIEVISETMFDGLTGLISLKLRNNHIKHINLRYSFVPLKSDDLIRSRIVSNMLNRNIGYQWASDHLLKQEATSTFRSLPQLNYLDLSFNNISYFYRDWAADMPNIARLNLSWNQFTYISEFFVDYSRLAVVIDLRHNNVVFVFLEPVLHKNDTPPTASSLILDHNPIHCDCSAYGLYMRLNGVRSREDPIYVMKDSGCVSPSHLKGQLLEAISPNLLACDLKPVRECARGIYRPATNEVVYDCSEITSSLPDEKTLMRLYNFYEEPTVSLKLDHQPESIEGFAIHTLNLSNAGINSLAFKPSESLKVLDVSNNNLSTIPDEFFEAKIALYISNNPLECDCSFSEKLLKYGLVGDLERATCGNGNHITEINVRQLCNRGTALGAIIANCAVGGLFLLMIVRAIYKNKKDISAYILSNLCGRDPGYTETIERRLDAAKQFDLFVSFAHQDEDFVTGSLLPKLENEFGQKVCVHSRDWVAGDLIVDQIIRSVDSSRRTIIVLTESFLLSEWSFFEFSTAHNLSIQEGRPRVIIVLLDEDISKDERLGPELKSYITINTYLLWGEPNFWEKLKKALPRRK